MTCPCHRKGCRPSRPRCRKARKPTLCRCAGLPWPHRRGSAALRWGACLAHPQADRIMFELTTGQDWETGERIAS